jgi:hypothetical protein
MFITKKHLSRRTVLRGAIGAAISLPLLDAMVPAASAAPPAQLRFGAIYVPNGIRPEIFTPASVGKLELPPLFERFVPLREHINLVTGVRAPDPFGHHGRGRRSTNVLPMSLDATRPCARSSSGSRASTARRTRASSVGAACISTRCPGKPPRSRCRMK